ncbi:MAG: hypothetical protein JEY97_07485 [Bacteroidales bacterium]|nr:hypothetical protein [Bacteroidales bacterium]
MMDIQTRKISFIIEFLKLQNEEIISQLEQLLKKGGKKTSSPKIYPMTLEEFNKRIDISLEDSKKGRLTESKS